MYFVSVKGPHFCGSAPVSYSRNSCPIYFVRVQGPPFFFRLIIPLHCSILFRIVKHTASDPALSELMKAISEGFVGKYKLLHSYMRYRDSFYVNMSAVMYKDRVVVPQSLRKCVLEYFHSAHQGVSTMAMRAQSIIFWPGM